MKKSTALLSSCAAGAVFSLEAELLLEVELSEEADWPPPQAARPKQRATAEAAITKKVMLNVSFCPASELMMEEMNEVHEFMSKFREEELSEVSF